MPGKKQKTVTLPEELYKHLQLEYEKHRVELFADKGIATFTGFAVYMMGQGIKQWRELKGEKQNTHSAKEHRENQ